jgi:hypothetical protein
MKNLPVHFFDTKTNPTIIDTVLNFFPELPMPGNEAFQGPDLKADMMGDNPNGMDDAAIQAIMTNEADGIAPNINALLKLDK